MRKIITFIAFLLNSIVFYAQEYPLERKDSLEDTSSNKKTNIDFYFQAELQASKRKEQPFYSQFQINYAQFNIARDARLKLSSSVRELNDIIAEYGTKVEKIKEKLKWYASK